MSPTCASVAAEATYVTGTVADHLFGVPIGRVRDVFNVGEITPVPLTPPEIAGLSNLRGRVVTMLDLRSRLGHGATGPRGALALGIEAGSESFGFVVDGVGEIVKLPADTLEACPMHLDPSWAEMSDGVHQLEDRLLVVLDVDAILTSIRRAAAGQHSGA